MCNRILVGYACVDRLRSRRVVVVMQFQPRRAIVPRVTTTVALFYCKCEVVLIRWIDFGISEAVLGAPALLFYTSLIFGTTILYSPSRILR